MIQIKPIKCPQCGTTVINDERELMLRVIVRDIKCPRCRTVVIPKPQEPIL